MAATEAQRRWASGNHAPDRLCSECGAAFYTSVGLSEHARLGCGNGHGSPVQVRRDPRRNLIETGRAVTALNNARRVRCGECELVTTPGPLALHQRTSGHAGRTELR